MKTYGVLGAGTMGSGIIQTLVQSGAAVHVCEVYEPAIEKSKVMIRKNLDRRVQKGKMTAEDADAAMDRIEYSADIRILRGADIVIEAATENPNVKKDLFRQMDEALDPSVILASNTSSLSITEIGAATKRPDRVVGMHFFNPAPVMKLIEVVRGLCASDETVEAILELARSLGKTPVQVKEAPGFIVNRILVPEINEAASIVYDGVASAEDVDTAMKLGANHPMGPLELGDLIGLDICLAIMETLYREYGDPKYRPNILLKQMVAAGKLGRKTGEGFYHYEG